MATSTLKQRIKVKIEQRTIYINDIYTVRKSSYHKLIMSTANVLRYSALGLGFLIGFKTDWSLKSEAKEREEEDKYQAKVKLVKEARAEYRRLHPVVATPGKVEVNLDDPNFDFGKFIEDAIGSVKA